MKHAPPRKKILIVDDAPENIHLLSKNLEESYDVLFATDGEKALEIATSDERLDLILLDIIMPGVDGYEVCSRLKADPGTRDIPVIFITAMPEVADETRGLELGALDYISKPFRLAVVRARVAAALRLKEEMDQRLKLTRQLQELNRDLEKRVNEKVAELKRAHEHLKISEAKYRSIFENSVEGIFQSSSDGRYLSVSPSMAAILGYDSSKDLIDSVTDIGAQVYENPDDRQTFIDRLNATGVVKGFEPRFRKKNGELIWVSLSGRLVYDAAGAALYAEGFCVDITRQKEAERALRESEEKLHQAQKMEAIGALASGIAHDFNNILTPIGGYAELCMASFNPESQEYEYLHKSYQAIQRATKLVKQILSFSRKAERARRPLQITPIIKEALKLLQSAFPATIEIVQHLDSEGMTSADPVEIHQVVMNLCTNALHAMELDGGVMTISLTDVEAFADSECAGLKPPSGKCLKLEVADTGYGIAPDIKDRVFDPYFTTKSKEEGTGLGLATVHGIVKDLNGTISVASEPGKGSTFTIYLPRVADSKDRRVEGKLSSSVPLGSERVLLVDDDRLVCEMLTAMLGSLGYRVTNFLSAPEALAAFVSRPGEFDILVTDMTMPKMTGVQLSRQVKAIRPELPVIIITGFSKLIGEEEQQIGISEVVMKPVIRYDIATALRRALESNGQ